MESTEIKWNGLVIEVLNIKMIIKTKKKIPLLFPLYTFRILPIGPIKTYPGFSPNKFEKISYVDVNWKD